MDENNYFDYYLDGLYRFFDVRDAPDGSPLPIENFRPGIKKQLGSEWDTIVDEYRLIDEDLETEEIDIGRKTAYRLLYEHPEIAHRRIGRSYRISKESLINYIRCGQMLEQAFITAF